LPDGISLFHHLSCMGHNILTDRGDLHRTIGTLEYRHPELCLKLFNLPAEGRLADGATLCRLAEVTCFRYSNDVFQISEIHPVNIISIIGFVDYYDKSNICNQLHLRYSPTHYMMLEKHHIAAIQAAVVIQITQHYLRVCRSDRLNDQPDQNQVITGIDNAIRFVAWRQLIAPRCCSARPRPDPRNRPADRHHRYRR
jgi:hypothetical protein